MKWTNCKKKKPEALGEVLIAYKSIHKTFNMCIGMYHSGSMWGFIGTNFIKIESSKIYWKKLPKPPKK